MSEANPTGPHQDDQPQKGDPPPSKGRGRFSFKRPGVILTTAVLLALVCFYGLRYLVNARTHESTDDAFIEADIVSLAPKVSGQVQAVHVNDNQFVRNGDLLLEIDPRDYQARVNERRAALQASNSAVVSAESNLQQARSRVASAEAALAQHQAEAESVAANAAKAEADLRRNQELLQQKTISPQEFDAARATASNEKANLQAARHKVASAEADLAAARNQVTAAEAAIASAQAQVRQAEADLQSAQLDLSYTKIHSPEDGWVTRKAVEPGSYVQVGQNLMALVPTNLWVIANFKETQLRDMRPGQPARIKVSAYPQNSYSGHVDSIQAGSGARFSLLPPENAVGNFVKVVQRVPVKILFNEALNTRQVYGPGMSVIPSVKVKSSAVPIWLLAIIAVVIGVLAALLGFRRAAKSRNEETAKS
jgi:membrane fusion protein (multidrug efflux system)